MAKIRIGDLKPNPFRRMDRYPIDRNKLEALKGSIKETSFWDNLLARAAPDGDGCEIAYGHHRLIALRELQEEGLIGDEVDIPVRHLDDAMMIRIMGNENMDTWGTNTTVMMETVQVAKDFIEAAISRSETADQLKRTDKFVYTLFADWNQEERENFQRAKKQGVGEPIIRKFLGSNWKKWMVQGALAVLNDTQIDREAVESFENAHQAEAFRTAVKEKGVPKEEQAPLAKEILRRIGNQGQKLTARKIEEHVHAIFSSGKAENRPETKKNGKPDPKEKEGHSKYGFRSGNLQKFFRVAGFMSGDKIYIMPGRISLYDGDRSFVAPYDTDFECSIKDRAGFITLVKKISDPFRIFRAEEKRIVLETQRISASFECEDPGPDHRQAFALARGDDVPWKQTPPNLIRAVTSCAISVHPDEGSFGPFGAIQLSGEHVLSFDLERASQCALPGGVETPVAIPLSRIPYIRQFWAADGSISRICFSGEWFMHHTEQDWYSVRSQNLDPELAEYPSFPHPEVRAWFEKERQTPIFVKLRHEMQNALKRALPVKKDETDLIKVTIDRNSFAVHRGGYRENLPIENGPQITIRFMINHRNFIDALQHEEINSERSCEIDLAGEVIIFQCDDFKHVLKLRRC